MTEHKYRVATDVGGTFTDLVYFYKDADNDDAGILKIEKVDTTPPDFEQGVIQTLEKANIDPKKFVSFAHGTTVVINALLSRNGAKTGLITTRGFRDVLEIARGNRPDLFNFRFQKPAPFVERYLRNEITERISYQGEILTQPKLEELDEILLTYKEEGIEAIAICFLHAYCNPSNEKAVADYVRTQCPDISVIASHEVCREWREYERTNTTVLSAYIHPIAKRYLNKLNDELGTRGMQQDPYIMQSNGGIATVRAASNNPITMVESGPASGMLGAMALGEIIGEKNLIALDIGGTTAKCSLIKDGKVRISTKYMIEHSRFDIGYPIKTPVIEIVEIGNGGGSVAWVDEGGSLRVGPQSAGAFPGPAAYGRGGIEPTTTDAHLLTGRIPEDYFMAGERIPDMQKVREAFTPLADELNVSIEEVALGVIRIANANMINALKLISVNKGYDPRDFSLIVFGGGGAMHGVSLAEEFNISRVIIPINAGVFSAWGMLMTDLRRDLIRTQLFRLGSGVEHSVQEFIQEIETDLRQEFADDALDSSKVRVEYHLDMRYQGQEHTVKVELDAVHFDESIKNKLIDSFHVAHEKEYTFRLSSHAVEIVNFHLVGFFPVEKPELPSYPTTAKFSKDLARATRMVTFDKEGKVDTPVYRREKLLPGMRFDSPALIEEPSTTVLVAPGKSIEIDQYKNIIIHIE